MFEDSNISLLVGKTISKITGAEDCANDAGLSFDDIANIIEANPEKFFTHSV